MSASDLEEMPTMSVRESLALDRQSVPRRTRRSEPVVAAIV